MNLTGTGAELYGARWNSPGRPVVYTSSCGALAALEYTAHVGAVSPRRLKLLWIDIPDSLGREEIASVPATPIQFRQYGDEWLARQQEPLLFVPSVLVPAQRNILITLSTHMLPSSRYRKKYLSLWTLDYSRVCFNFPDFR